MTEEVIPDKILKTKMEGKLPRGGPRIRWIDQIRKCAEMRGKIQENWKCGIEMTGDFSARVESYLSKRNKINK